MLELFAHNLLPVFLAAGAGYVLAWRLGVDARPVAQLAFFVFAPALVFRIILDSELAGDALVRMVGFTAVSLLALGGGVHVERLATRGLLLLAEEGSAVALEAGGVAGRTLADVDTAAGRGRRVGTGLGDRGHRRPRRHAAGARRNPSR